MLALVAQVPVSVRSSAAALFWQHSTGCKVKEVKGLAALMRCSWTGSSHNGCKRLLIRPSAVCNHGFELHAQKGRNHTALTDRYKIREFTQVSFLSHA